MKKIIALVMVLVMVFVFCACGKSESEDNLQYEVSIDCSMIAQNMDSIENEAIVDLIPEDGIVFSGTVGAKDPGSVMDATIELCKAFEISYDCTDGYLTMLADISAGDCGGWSGWLVKVNGEFPQVGADEIDLNDGDTVEWIYSLDGGSDIGAW